MNRRALVVMALCVSGCGFQPVYRGATGKDPGPAPDLAAIEVKPIYDRPGQILRETLKARLASDTGVPHRYDLEVQFSIAGEGLGVLNSTQFTRVRMAGTATWTLQTRDSKRTKLTSGSERSLDGIDLYDTQFFAADLDTERVQRRIAEILADKITLRLAVWFHQHPTAPG